VSDRVRFAIHYLTEYRYEEPVSDNLNVLRVTPASTPTQEVEDFRVRVDPEARLHRHTDYFGTQVVEFGITQPHEHLTIDVRARVATTEPPELLGGGWDALAVPGYRSAASEYLLPEPIAERWRGEVGSLAEAVRGATPADTLRTLCELIPDRFEYRPGVTYVGSTVEDLLEGGAGVCQDFAHLALALLRDLGIAARYVSGYFYAPAPDDADSASAEVQTHAWLEALLPAEDGGEPRWAGADPTNRRLAGAAHVKIGHGRRYADIPPIKGVFRGGSGSKMESTVRMTRADATGVPA
jgi:transglutaminase-like putative cysteine protease